MLAANGMRTLGGLETIIMRAFGQTLPQQSIKGPTMLAVGPSQTFRFVNSTAEVTK